jgi:hypothetical protein
MAYANSDDVLARWGKAEVEEEITTLIETRLGDIQRMIERGLKRRGLTTLSERIEDELTDLEDVKQVESDAVLRLVRNPEGYLSETDGDYTYMLRQDLASGVLELLPPDWEALGVEDASGMFVIVPRPVMPT